jgi:hypothetical protein
MTGSAGEKDQPLRPVKILDEMRRKRRSLLSANIG